MDCFSHSKKESNETKKEDHKNDIHVGFVQISLLNKLLLRVRNILFCNLQIPV